MQAGVRSPDITLPVCVCVSLTEVLRELKATGKLVAVMVILSYMYGDLTVSRQLTPDPRQHSWLLMTSPLPTIAACLLYVATVTWWGPRYMTSRNPLPNLRKVMMAYNAFQVVFSARIFWEVNVHLYSCG